MQWSENIIGLQHIGIPTNNMEETKAFYAALGFETTYETINGTEKVAFFKLKNIVIEAYENGVATMTSGAINHIAIDVKDIDYTYQEIQSKGFRIIEDISELPFWQKGVKYFIILGPNAERVEFNQYLR